MIPWDLVCLFTALMGLSGMPNSWSRYHRDVDTAKWSVFYTAWTSFWCVAFYYCVTRGVR